MKKLPDITMKDWLAAEKEVAAASIPVKPKDAITSDDFAALKGCSQNQASDVLRRMTKLGLARREKWYHGRYVYFLNKK